MLIQLSFIVKLKTIPIRINATRIQHVICKTWPMLGEDQFELIAIETTANPTTFFE